MKVATFIAYILYCIVSAVVIILFGQVYKQSGEPSISLQYAFSIFFNPLFIIALGLALTGSVLRMWMFHGFGISLTIVLSEFTLIFTLAFSAYWFKEEWSLQQSIGTILVLVGIFIAQFKF